MATTTDADRAEAIERIRIWLTYDHEPGEEYISAQAVAADLPGVTASDVEDALGTLEQRYPVRIQREYDPTEGVRWKIDE